MKLDMFTEHEIYFYLGNDVILPSVLRFIILHTQIYEWVLFSCLLNKNNNKYDSLNVIANEANEQ
jgi:hypothetical protein